MLPCSSTVSLNDVVEFAPGREPFRTFARSGRQFLNHPGVAAAIMCSETGVTPDEFRWALWRDQPTRSAEDELMFTDPEAFTQKTNADKPLTFSIGMLVRVDHGNKASYLARILKADVWDSSNDKGVGPHYYVHYHGWSDRYASFSHLPRD